MKKLIDLLQYLIYKTGQAWQWYKTLYKNRTWYFKTWVIACSFVAFFFFYLFAVDINLFWLFGRSPGFLDIRKPQIAEASVIYSADSVQIGKYFNQNRTPVEYEEVNPAFWRALIDTEDERYYKHWGIDPMGLMGAAKDAATGRGGRGASTITQQLAKNMFRVRTQYSTGLFGMIPGVKILIMKSKEWILATKLELYNAIVNGRADGKKNILTMYANTVDFGSNSFGIKTACRTYFNTTPDSISTSQAAVLVGMLKATTTYNPVINPENSLRRRNVVLQNMLNHGDLTEEEFAKYKEEPIDVSEFHVEENYSGKCDYFREAVAKYLKDWCEETDNDLYTSGLTIYTTIDTRMQKFAEKAVAQHMKQLQNNFNDHWSGSSPWQDEDHRVIPGFIEDIAKKLPVYKHLEAKYAGQPDSITYYLNKPHEVKVYDYEKGEITREMSTMDSIRYMVKFMHCGFVAMEPNTGHVKAWVGDINFNHWKYDKVTAQRQPGSTFKLFVYTEAMEQGLTPCDRRRDEAVTINAWDSKKKSPLNWTPRNANGTFSGDSLPLRTAFAKSVNSVAVRLGQEMGISNVIETAHAMGIHSPLEENPSLVLGSSDVNLLEMANAYCTVANYGKAHEEPVLVTKILDREGNVIYEGSTSTKQVISLKSAYLMQKMLLGGVRDGGGTSTSLNNYIGGYDDTDFGGKTGTTNNNSDAWFMGVSPNLVVGAWVGGEYRCIHFRTAALGQGARAALPICGRFLESLFGNSAFRNYHGKFVRPDGLDIDASMWDCSYEPELADTLEVDTLLDDDFVPIEGEQLPMNGGQNNNTDTKKATEPSETEVGFENL